MLCTFVYNKEYITHLLSTFVYSFVTSMLTHHMLRTFVNNQEYITHLLSTFVYSRVYIPFPGPPALNDPPPPIIMLRTHIGTKSASLWEQLSKPDIKRIRYHSPLTLQVILCQSDEGNHCILTGQLSTL